MCMVRDSKDIEDKNCDNDDGSWCMVDGSTLQSDCDVLEK